MQKYISYDIQELEPVRSHVNSWLVLATGHRWGVVGVAAHTVETEPPINYHTHTHTHAHARARTRTRTHTHTHSTILSAPLILNTPVSACPSVHRHHHHNPYQALPSPRE